MDRNVRDLRPVLADDIASLPPGFFSLSGDASAMADFFLRVMLET